MPALMLCSVVVVWCLGLAAGFAATRAAIHALLNAIGVDPEAMDPALGLLVWLASVLGAVACLGFVARGIVGIFLAFGKPLGALVFGGVCLSWGLCALAALAAIGDAKGSAR